MYVHLRRDSVAKESIHVLLGITPEGHKEILDYAILPSESALNYADMLKSLKIRGLNRYCSSSRTACWSPDAQNEFSRSRYQSCWVHLMRAVSLVRPSDRKVVLMRLSVYRQENAAPAKQELSAFSTRAEIKYKRLHKLFQNESSLFSFYEFPKSIQQTIYTSNPH